MMPGDDTFVEITNATIYGELKAQGDRISKIETHLEWGRRFWTTMASTITCGSALVAAVYYVNH